MALGKPAVSAASPGGVKPTETPIPTLAEALRYLWRVVRMMRGYWAPIAKGTALSISVSLVGMLTPFISKMYFDRVYPARDVTLLKVLVVGIFALTLTTSVVGAVRNYYSNLVSAQLNGAVGLMFFNHLQHLTVRFFDEHRVGEITSRFGNVSSSIGTVTGIFQTVIMNGTYLVIVPPLLLFMSPKLALLSLLTVPLTTIISTLSARWRRRFSKQNMEVSADLSAFQVESLTHIRTVKTLAAEHFVFQTASEQLHRAIELQLKAALLSLVVGLVNTVLRASGQALFTFVAWSEIIQQRMTLGEFMAFSMYIGFVSSAVSAFASLFIDFQSSAVSLGRMFEYLDAPVEQDPTQAYQPPPAIVQCITGDIRFVDVDFGYSREKRILHGVSFSAAPSSVTAIVGPSGAGKSTVLRLLCGMESPHNGRIWFGSVPAHEVSLVDLRRQVAVVWQEFSLMRGTIYQNLTFGLGEVPRDRVYDAIAMCRLSEVIADLPLGLDSPVGEWGATMSAGQRQRMAIARALLRDARILLLDEATANIDVEAEGDILRDVFRSLSDRTILFVTHRITTASLANQILVMDRGRLVGAGNHSDLMERNEVYRRLLTSSGVGPDDPRRLRVMGSDHLPTLR